MHCQNNANRNLEIRTNTRIIEAVAPKAIFFYFPKDATERRSHIFKEIWQLLIFGYIFRPCKLELGKYEWVNCLSSS